MSSDPAIVSERVALVTGAGSGIGRASARALVDASFVTLFAGRTEATLAEACTGLDPERAIPIVLDVTDPASVLGVFQTIEARFGRLDLLFNNAGLSLPATPIELVAYDDWRRVIDTNLTGAFLCAQHAFRLMKTQTPRGGRIINNGSVATQSPRPRATAYTVAKTGMTGLTRSLALDGRGLDIACGQIDIGNAATAMAADQVAGIEQADGSHLAEPAINVDLVAQTIVHMASLPLSANMPFLTLMPTRMPLIGRG